LLMDERNHGHNITNTVMPSSPLITDAMEVDEEDEEATPRPRFVKRTDVDLGQETEIEDSDEAFKTPLLSLAKRNKYLTAKMIQNTEDSSEEQEDVDTEEEQDFKKHKVCRYPLL
jgi:hypothetical protein